MTRPSFIIRCLLLSALLTTSLACSSDQHAADQHPANDVSLLESMSWMQTYTHKLLLSADAKNQQLVDFYLHELEELAEDVIGGVPEYDGFPVGELVEAMLLSEIERVEQVAAEGDWQQTIRAVTDLVASCNACHVATDHGYIRIENQARENPFLQDFQP